MPIFKYIARNRNGDLATGALEGASSTDVASELISGGLYPSRIEITRIGPFERLNIYLSSLRRISDEERITLTSRFATLLKAGLPVNSILMALSDQTEDMAVRDALLDIHSRIEEGETLSQAMAFSPKLFPEVYVRLVQAGEMSGSLDRCFNRVEKLLEFEMDIKHKVREATRYPKILSVAFFMALVVAMAFIVPRYAAIFEKVKMELPLPTQIMIGASGFVQNYGLFLLFALIMVIVISIKTVNSIKGRRLFDIYIIRTPLIGDLLLKIYTAQWAFTLGELIRAGVPIIESIKMAGATIENGSLGEVAKGYARIVEEGEGLAVAISAGGFAKAPTAEMVAAGEQSGTLDDMLLKVGEYFTKETTRTIKKMSTYIEPVLIVVISAFVLGLALSIFLPMWEMTGLARRG